MLWRLKAAAWRLEYQHRNSFVLLRARTRVGVCLQWADRHVAWSCPSMRWKFGVELERPSVRRPEVELL